MKEKKIIKTIKETLAIIILGFILLIPIVIYSLSYYPYLCIKYKMIIPQNIYFHHLSNKFTLIGL